MEFEKLIYNLDFDKDSKEKILSFEYFFLTKNIKNIDDLKKILSYYTFLENSDLEKTYNLYLDNGNSFYLENEFLNILNNTLYKKYLNIPKLKNLGKHIDKYNIILDQIYQKIQKTKLKIEELNDNDLEDIENELKRFGDI